MQKQQERTQVTPLAHLSDDELLAYGYSKDGVTDLEVELLLRQEMLLNDYRSLLENVHATACEGIEGNQYQALVQLRDMTQPVEDPTRYVN
jgi:hypothetical protein